MSIETAFGIVIYSAIGYSGGWLFRADNHLIERYGMLLAFFIVYFALWIQIGASIFLGAEQNWLYTAPYVASFLYRFFHYG